MSEYSQKIRLVWRCAALRVRIRKRVLVEGEGDQLPVHFTNHMKLDAMPAVNARRDSQWLAWNGIAFKVLTSCCWVLLVDLSILTLSICRTTRHHNKKFLMGCRAQWLQPYLSLSYWQVSLSNPGPAPMLRQVSWSFAPISNDFSHWRLPSWL